MRQRILLLCLLLCAIVHIGVAQSIRMEAGSLAFEYPDDWLVLSPQLTYVYEPLLSEAGISAEDLASDMQRQNILSCAYNADYSQHVAVSVWETEYSQQMFDISRASTADRRSLRRQTENNSLYNVSGYRTQDAEWQTVGERYWLYSHYLITTGGETIGRGLRYLTIHNGQYVALDWQIGSGRFSNRDLASFKTQVRGLTFTREMEEPMKAVRLEAELPTETNRSLITISGTATPGATVTLEVENERMNRRTVGETTAGAKGSFKLEYVLEYEGESELILHAHAEEMIDSTLTGWITYNSKTLPVSGIEENQTTTEDTVILTGKTLAGAQLQLVTPFGLSKKRAGNDGSFSFELNTKEEGTYEYTLLLEKSGYVQRRVPFVIVRIKTDDQQKADIRKSAVKIAYKDLQKGLESNNGKIMNLYGLVTEVSSGGDLTYIRMQYSKTSGGKWINPVILVSETPEEVKAGEFISVVAEVDGIYEEQDSAGNDINVPRLNLLFIDRVE